jgi:hypothetical protein
MRCQLATNEQGTTFSYDNVSNFLYVILSFFPYGYDWKVQENLGFSKCKTNEEDSTAVRIVSHLIRSQQSVNCNLNLQIISRLHAAAD